MVVEPNPHVWVTKGWVWADLDRGLLSCASTSYLGCQPPHHTSLLVVHQGTQNLAFLPTSPPQYHPLGPPPP